MIVVDTSVWIDFFNGNSSRESSLLDYYLGTQLIVIGDLIIVELLQGFREDHAFQKAKQLMHDLTYRKMTGEDLAYQAADHYRYLRKKGVTIRKTIDVMIATFCISTALPLLHCDRDFEVIAKHLKLQTL